MAEGSSKKRIFQIAKELNISHKDIIEYLCEEGISVSSPNAPIEFELYEKILGEFSKEKMSIDRFRKEQARKAVVDTRRKTDIKRDDKTGSQDPEDVKQARENAIKREQEKESQYQSLKDSISKEQDRLETLRAADEAKREAEEKERFVQEETRRKELEEQAAKEQKAKTEEEPELKGSKLKIISRPEPVKEPEPMPEPEKVDKIPVSLPVKPVPPKKAAKQDGKPSQRKGAAPSKPSRKPAAKAQPERKQPPRKLKKIDVSAIADKVNQSRSGKQKASDSKAKAAMKAPLPQFGKKSSRKKYRKTDRKTEGLPAAVSNKIKVPEFTTVDELAQTMNVNASEIIKVCMMNGMMVTINQRLDMESIILIADEFGFEVDSAVDVGEELISHTEPEEDLKNATPRPPVVTIMGHVDHGKTSLLDHVRKANVVAGESGGITQHIGAYQVTLEGGEQITFLDTPGHAAFTAMRARGAQVTDIVVVIIAADDGIMPQTVEALDHAKAANVPIVIAINKVDLPAANVDKIKRELSERNILVEDWGGKYQSAEISAKTGLGIDELMEKILLEAEVLDLKANKDTLARGAVIESRLDKGLGAVATVLIQKGTLHKGDIFICGSQYSRVRDMKNERNQRLAEAYPSYPVQVLGFTEVPNAGEDFIIHDDEREARRITLQRSQLKREAEHRRVRRLTLDQIGKQIAEGQVQNLDIIIKGDVDGSIEALSDSLMALSTKEVAVNIIHRSVGMITETDITLAAASKAIVLAFHVSTTAEAKNMARLEDVEIRHYTVIYEAVNEVKLALEGLLSPDTVEEALGMAEVRTLFRVGRREVIAGSYVRSGKAVRNALLRIKRNDEQIHEGKLTSLKRFKDDANEVKEGFECGIAVEGFNDFIEGDIIEFYELKEVKRTLK